MLAEARPGWSRLHSVIKHENTARRTDVTAGMAGRDLGPGLVVRGVRERLRPILMTALARGLAVLPLVVAGEIPCHEIEHPMVIVGGLVTSTLLNLFVVPSLYLRFA